MDYRVFVLFAAGLFLSACGSDEAATESAASPAGPKTESSVGAPAVNKGGFTDPAYGGDIVASDNGEIITIPEEHGSEYEREGGIPKQP
jgi:hypothetical protein